MASSTLDNGQAQSVSELIDDAGLANAVPPAKQDRVIRSRNVREDRKKGLEVYGHFLFAPGSGLLDAFPLSKYNPNGVEMQVFFVYC